MERSIGSLWTACAAICAATLAISASRVARLEPLTKVAVATDQAAKSTPAAKTSAQEPASDRPAPAASAAYSEEMQRVRAAARAVLVKGLLDLAAWCNSKELYLERDHVYARVIELESDNLDARKGLRYARNPDGSWKDPAPREMKNRNPKALEELPAKRAESVAG